MTYAEFCAARQLITEERLGKAVRARQRAEDEAAAELRVALQKQEAQVQPRIFPEVAADAPTLAERARLRTVQPRPITTEVLG